MFCFRNKVPGGKVKKYTALDLLANSDWRCPLLSCGPADNSAVSFHSCYHQTSGSRRKGIPRRDSKHVWNSLVWHLRHCFRSNLVSFWACLPQCTSPYIGPHVPPSTTRLLASQTHSYIYFASSSIRKALFSITAYKNPKYAMTSSLNAHKEPSVDVSISQTLIKSSASQLCSLWTMWAKSNLGTASFLVPFLALGPNYLYCHLFPSVLIKPVPSSSHLCVAPSLQYVSSRMSWVFTE